YGWPVEAASEALLERLEQSPSTRRGASLLKSWARHEESQPRQLLAAGLESLDTSTPDQVRDLARRAAWAARTPAVAGAILEDLDRQPATRPVAEFMRSWPARLGESAKLHFLQAALERPGLDTEEERLRALVDGCQRAQAAYVLQADHLSTLCEEALRLSRSRPASRPVVALLEPLDAATRSGVMPSAAACWLDPQPEEVLQIGRTFSYQLPVARSALRALTTFPGPMGALAQIHAGKLRDNAEDQAVVLAAFQELGQQAEHLREVQRLVENKPASGVELKDDQLRVGSVRLKVKQRP
ncbi:MAG: hypothetical protein AB1758_26700, partial [Candidatus Eremiobacterota bacterium]